MTNRTQLDLVRRPLHLTREQDERLKELAKEQGQRVSVMARIIVQDYLALHPRA